jgi:hypothetical protein
LNEGDQLIDRADQSVSFLLFIHRLMEQLHLLLHAPQQPFSIHLEANPAGQTRSLKRAGEPERHFSIQRHAVA